MGRLFDFVRYRTRDGAIDFDEVRALARQARPKLIVAGFSSYPRELDYGAFRAIADEVGALAMADVSHVGGLIAAGVLANPLDAGFDFLATTTHKTLRGPRGGLILCKAEHARRLDASVFPGLQGGPHMNQVAAAAAALKLAAGDDFKAYARQVLANAQALAAALREEGAALVTGGTDNHLLVVDVVVSFGLDGAAAERALDAARITVNKQIILDDPRPPLRPSGIRLGTPAATARGMRKDEMRTLATLIGEALRNASDDARLARLGEDTRALCAGFPVPGL